MANPDVPKYGALDESARITWIGKQISALNYMAHVTREVSEIDLLVEAKMLDAAVMADGGLRSLTQPEMQEAFRCGVTKDYGDYYGITAASLAGFLRSFIKSDRRKRAAAIIHENEERERLEGERRFWQAMYEAKRERGLELAAGEKIRFETAEDHRRMIEEQRRRIYEAAKKEGGEE